MPEETIKEILMRRDNNTPEEAEERIQAAIKELGYLLAAGDKETAYNICEDHFDLEPDYLTELINF